MDLEMEKALKSGLMVQSILVTGLMTKPIYMGSCIMQMEIFMKENGQMTKPMGEACTLMLMVQNIMESGKMISNTEKELSLGLMEQCMKENTMKGKKMEKVN